MPTVADVGFKLILRDISTGMVKAWNECSFGTDDKYKELVEVAAAACILSYRK